MLESLEDILADGLTYSSWLTCKADRLCDVEKYTAIENDPQVIADSEASQRAIDAMLADLQQMEADRDESEEDFNAALRARFEADETKEIKSSGVDVPDIPEVCP